MLPVLANEHTIAVTLGKPEAGRFRFRSRHWEVLRYASTRLYCILRLLQLRRPRFEESCPPI
jgi:hypothetical protein